VAATVGWPVGEAIGSGVLVDGTVGCPPALSGVTVGSGVAVSGSAIRTVGVEEGFGFLVGMDDGYTGCPLVGVTDGRM
jgi:hypothetical protein